MLVFDYYRYGKDPSRPSLVNGHINPLELAGQKVDVFASHEHGDHFDSTVLAWKAAIGDLTYVFGFRPERLPQYAQAGYNGPAYEYIGPREQREIDGMKITTIAGNDAGVGFLIDVDGLKIYHAGDHAGWATGQRDGYIAEIDYLAGLTSNVDMAFLNVTGCHTHDTLALAEGTWYTLDKLRPKAWFPTHGGDNERAYAVFAQKAADKAYGKNILVPEARGDHYIYRRVNE
jgi:L-ascorbate metabolism protein UlaG (beta-lactamase superfamily)